MEENPYETPKVLASGKRRYNAGPSASYALLAFPIAWLVFPIMWLVNVAEHGFFVGFWYELAIVFWASISMGTLGGGALALVLSGILWLARRWNETRPLGR